MQFINSCRNQFEKVSAAIRNRAMADDWQKKGKRILKIALSVFRTLFIISLSFVLLYPLIIMLSISLRNGNELYDPTVIWIPRNFTLSNYIYAFNKLEYMKVALLTGQIALVGTVFQLISCSLAGYTFARFKFRFKNLLFAILILTIIVPPQIVAIPAYLNFIHFDFFGIGSLVRLISGTGFTVNLIDNLWAYYLPALCGAGIKSGLFIFIFMQFFRGLPKELEDASYIDGCGRLSTFVRIMLPNSGGAFLTTFLFSFVWYWNDFFINSMFFNNLQTMSRVLQNISINLGSIKASEKIYDLIPRTEASAVLSVLPVLLIYIVLQKYFTEGIERTGIVG